MPQKKALSKLTPSRAAALLSALALGVVALSGCTYSRVVEARGLGADKVQVEEPYQESGDLDRWIFGDEPSKKQQDRRR